MTRFERDYARELAYLRDRGRRFAATHPHNAALLDHASDDPDVERLLEGFAFLSAGIRAQIDDAAGLFARRLLSSIGPHWIRPTPAATVVELRPDLRVLRSVQRIPRGKEILAAPTQGVCARFTTAADVDLAPIELEGHQIVRERDNTAHLRLRFRASDAGAATVAELDRLRLFIHHSDPTVAATLTMWLCRYCTSITTLTADTHVTAEDSTASIPAGDGPRILLPFADPLARLQPWPETTPPAIRTLVEGLAYPNFASFIDLEGLRSLHLEGPRFELVFHVASAGDQPSLPDLPQQLPCDTFRLHCTPALNLFATTGEPFEHLPGDRPHLVRADDTDPQHMEVYAITDVSVDGIPAHRRICGILPADERAPIYDADRSHGDGERSECRLTLETSTAIEPKDPAIVSTKILCTSGALPHDLGVGALGHGPRHLLLASVSNITAVTPPRSPAIDADQCWRALDHLGLRLRSVSSALELRDLLSLHAPTDTSATSAILGERSIAAIRELRRHRTHQLIDAIPTPVIETVIELDSRELTSNAEAELLGALLDPLVSAFAGLEAASLLTIQLFPAGERLSWPLRSPTGVHP